MRKYNSQKLLLQYLRNALVGTFQHFFPDICSYNTAPTGPPLNITITIVGQTSFQVQWNQISNNLSSAILGYRVLYYTTGNSSWYGAKEVNASVFAVIITGMETKVETEYCASVLTFNKYGDGPESSQCVRSSGWSGMCSTAPLI